MTMSDSPNHVNEEAEEDKSQANKKKNQINAQLSSENMMTNRQQIAENAEKVGGQPSGQISPMNRFPATGSTPIQRNPKPKPAAPRVGVPIQQVSAAALSQARPQVRTSVDEQKPPTQASQRPIVGTPVGASRPTVGTPVGDKPAASTTAAATVGKAPAPATRPSVGNPRPSVSSQTAVKPATPKLPESKQEISRRNFIKGLAIVGGIIAVAQFIPPVDSYLRGSTEGSGRPTQVIHNGQTGKPITTSDVSENNWTTFVYPRTGNPNIDNDTFRQFVIIHLPKGFAAPSNLSAKDPISGDTFVALSRVCVHLWCLWSYVPTDKLCECPCHGSEYVPGTGLPYNDPPGLAIAGPASLQTPPNNQLPMATIKIASDGTISATGIVGQIGCGQKC